MKKSKLPIATDFFLATGEFELVDYGGIRKFCWEEMRVGAKNELVDGAVFAPVKNRSIKVGILYFFKDDEFGYIIVDETLPHNIAWRGSTTGYRGIMNMIKMIDEDLKLKIYESKKERTPF